MIKISVIELDGIISNSIFNKKNMLLEIACFSLEAAIIAEESGADRIELCSGPLEGGLTPSIAMIALARNILKIPIHVMIRPREGELFIFHQGT